VPWLVAKRELGANVCNGGCPSPQPFTKKAGPWTGLFRESLPAGAQRKCGSTDAVRAGTSTVGPTTRAKNTERAPRNTASPRRGDCGGLAFFSAFQTIRFEFKRPRPFIRQLEPLVASCLPGRSRTDPHKPILIIFVLRNFPVNGRPI
jgi:hypothetical protein